MATAATSHHIRQTRQRRASPLWWFVPLSLLLHAGLLWYWQPSPAPVAARHATGMAVQLVERQQQEPAEATRARSQTATTAARANTVSSPKPLSQPVKPKQTEAPSVTPGAPATHETLSADSEPVTVPTTINEAALQSSLKVTLQQEIARHFSYPLLARRRGWQGEVLLAFRLESDGRIIDARVARSSGYGVLDRAALDALGKVGRISPGTEYGFAMQLPVIYRLEG
jgi:protein TonB